MQIRPQKGFQETALSSPADVAILGGSAGCGKTYTLLLESLRHVDNKKYQGVIFRRTTPQIKNPGALWDTSVNLYPFAGGVPKESVTEWNFPSGASMKFSHMEYEKNVSDWQGSAVAFVGYDELTHFTYKQFYYLVSRNRTDSGVRPYIRATCNPDPDSWVAKFISWWIDPDTGFPIPERQGKLRYMTADNGVYVWGDTPEEVKEKCPHIFNDEKLKGLKIKDLVKSVTFIGGTIYENKKFLKSDPSYLGSLLSLPEEEKSQLLDGNWAIRTDGLGLFHYKAINDIYSNFPESSRNPIKCITSDPARFGRDLCIIMVWKGWEVIHISIFVKSDVHDIVKEIERLRMKFNVQRSDVIVDQDGVGGDSVKLGQYTGFKGGSAAMRDHETRVIENYKNLKTQCYYRLAINHVNIGAIRVNVSSETVCIFEDGKLTGKYTTKIKIGGEVRDVRDIISEQLRAIKRDKIDEERKFQINSKEEQKNILGGASPDFADTLMMREYVDLRGRPKNLVQQNGNNENYPVNFANNLYTR